MLGYRRGFLLRLLFLLVIVTTTLMWYKMLKIELSDSTFRFLSRFASSEAIISLSDNEIIGLQSQQTGKFGCKKFYDDYEWKSHPQLPRKQSAEEQKRMLNLLVTVDICLSRGNFTYMLYAGTLLGSWLFHDFIPWDDDIDILASHADKDKIVGHLRYCGGTEYRIVNHNEFTKFYPSSGERISHHQWTWPSLDIFYYGENETHFWEVHHLQDRQRRHTHEKSVIGLFPLHSRPLGGLLFPSPRDAYAFMKIRLSKYDKRGQLLLGKLPEFKCQLHSWDHRLEKSNFKKTALKCADIYPYYPVVDVHYPPLEYNMNRGVIETLLFGNTTLQECYINEPSYAVHYPLSFVLKPKT